VQRDLYHRYIDRHKCCLGWIRSDLVMHGQGKRTFAMVRSQFCSMTFDRREIWVEWEYLQLFGVEIVRHLK
jgi:hypothetical protein